MCYLTLAVFLSEDPLKRLRIRVKGRIQHFDHIPVHYQVTDKNKKLAYYKHEIIFYVCSASEKYKSMLN